MRLAPVIFWVVAAAVLGVLAVQLRPSAETGDQAGGEEALTLGVDLASVRELRARDAGGRVITIARTDDRAGSWVVSSDAGLAWPSDDELTRAGLRVLASAELTTRTGDEGLETGAASFAWTDGSGQSELRWSGSPIGGRIPAVLALDGGARAVWIETRLANALTTESLSRWRSAAVLDPGGAVSVLEVSLADRGVRLERTGSGWTLGGDASVPVDRARIDAAVRAVTGMKAVGLDVEKGGWSGEPIASVRVGAIDGSERVLDVLGATAAGKRAHAVARGGAGDRAFGPMRVEVESAPLDALSPDPWAYLRGTPIDGDRVDVASIEVLAPGAGTPAARAARAIDGWRIEGARAPEETGALVALLTARRAGAVRAPGGEETVGVIRVHDATLPAPIDVALVRVEGGHALMLQAESLSVLFEYPEADEQAALAWAAGLLGPG